MSPPAALPRRAALAARCRGWLTAGGVALLLALGCGCEQQRVTEADCQRIGAQLQQAWLRDARAAVDIAQTTGQKRYIEEEANRIDARWKAECARLVGRPVLPAELACLDRAQSIDDVKRCESP